MSTRTVNLTILTILIVELLSGLASYLVGTPDARWVFWVHRSGGFASVPLFGWKIAIITRSYRKRGLTGSTALSALLGALFLGAYLYGVLWSTTGAPGVRLPLLGALTGLGVHVTLVAALLPLLALHVNGRWQQVRLRRPDFASRRAALRYLGLSAAGLAVWQASEALSATAGWSGRLRRFTGSRETGSLLGNAFPSTNWFADPRPTLDGATWRLRIHGAVAHESTLSLVDLAGDPSVTTRAILDCTGGWYTTQDWSGVPLSALLDQAGISPSACSVVVYSTTGYTRRYALSETDNLLLATQVGGEPLTHGHGYPLRLVAPGRRGYDWVKWVVAIEVSDLPGWMQSLLPLQ